MRHSLLLTLLTTSVLTVPAYAGPTVFDGDITTTLTGTTDYVSRGFSQNDDRPSVILNSTWAHASGLHADLFATPIDFNTPNDNAHAEVDFSLGYSIPVTDKFSADVGATYAYYPGANSSLDYDYAEATTTLTYEWDSVTLNTFLAYSPEYTGHSGQSLFAEAEATVPLSIPHFENASLVTAYGRQMVEDAPSYSTWHVGMVYDITNQLAVDITYHDTDINKSECSRMCSQRIVLSAAFSF